ncbi:hypothetical protein F3Y22_tig00112443pilonHSYRG00028 [Hibiscus syriacus]|uniref:Gnk2-homologous domain-containing protein n=1 Tax=Hibiscus syriacus TaxID=106335 RepID=A0A6A2WZ15_HIBSY|nr:hypothetical protein F3Y22_tig00112443pilonHSYRG00028 [Hibiscus syriacus]
MYDSDRVQPWSKRIPWQVIPPSFGADASYFGCSDSFGAGSNPISFGCSNSRNQSSYNFEANLNKLILYLSTNAPPRRFALGVVGETPDKVYSLALCRRDYSDTDCKTCILKTGCFIRMHCPDYGAAVIRYDTCLLRFLNVPFHGGIDNLYEIYESDLNKVSESDSFDEKTRGFYMWNLNNVSKPETFNQKTTELLSELAQNVCRRRDGAVGSEKLYGLAQCRRDLSSRELVVFRWPMKPLKTRACLMYSIGLAAHDQECEQIQV